MDGTHPTYLRVRVELDVGGRRLHVPAPAQRLEDLVEVHPRDPAPRAADQHQPLRLRLPCRSGTHVVDRGR